MFNSKINYSPEVREEVISILNKTIANLTDLKSQYKNAHWNVKGQNFYSLHLLFDRLSDGFDSNIDKLAERLTALGGTVGGTIRQSSYVSILNDSFPQPIDCNLFVLVLINMTAIVQAANIESIDALTRLNDQATLNMLVEVEEILGLHLYLLEAHQI